MNIVKKIIIEEFGERKYNTWFNYYVQVIEKTMDNKEIESIIEDDMYKILQLQNKNLGELKILMSDIKDCSIECRRIIRMFPLVVITFVFCNIMLSMFQSTFLLQFIFHFLLLIGMIHKIYEYITIKYCFIDFSILNIYSKVVIKLLNLK